ncbi:MAG TPA: bifunctional lysylphosphatidylglycerol flippase/synthetase MprF [Candidatus Polarisedimenticolaceae bacterium]|nr:bifunctional lysylphosphatidylglycerol flippase/synthetase MprF [Candidatus Polarisedimenticolaceae bacterium]
MTSTVEAAPRARGALARLLPAARAAWPWILLAAVAIVGWKELRQVDLVQVRTLLRATDATRIFVILLATAANLALAGAYDVIALGPPERSPALSRRFSVGVVAFAWSNFLTIGPLAGPALRVWLYGSMGVALDRGRRALVIVFAAFTCGLLAWCAAVALPLPGALDAPAVRTFLAAGLCIALALAAARLPALWPGELQRTRRLGALGLAAVAFADWLLAWLVFHAAIKTQVPSIGAAASLPTFFFGQLVGLASLVPGGLGSADLFWGARLSAMAGSHDQIAAALVLYRSVYYVLPFLFASLVLAGRLVSAGRRTAAIVRTGLASYAFLCGAVLLASAASPSLADRSRWLQQTVPLILVEISHGTSIALGFLLIVMSRGLARGYRSSHRISVALFLAAALTTFLKGLDYEEAILALAAVALLLIFRGVFERQGRLHPSLEFVAGAGLAAVLLFGAVGLGSYDAWPDVPSAFSRFAFLAHEERFVRGLIVLGAVAAIVALRLGQRPRSPDVLPPPAAIDGALQTIGVLGHGTPPLLVATGDKAIFRSPGGGDGFVLYRTAGRFLVAWSDPVCGAGLERRLLSDFTEHAADWDREAILYQISPQLLPAAHDLGYVFFKLGEEAMIDLRAFDLKGNKAKAQRHAMNVVERAGGRFRVVSGAELRDLLPALRRVSDTWLAGKKTTEKAFSLGRFDETYLMRFPCAVVESGDGRVVAFANVLEGPINEEISVDMMRYDGTVDPALGTGMEYLLLSLMRDAKARGFGRFNLGMAPLATVGEARRARPIERLARQFFLHGEAWYNYQGLRRFKERFHPSWEPRYMAYRRPWDWPFAVAATTQLISGRWSAFIPGRGSRG